MGSPSGSRSFRMHGSVRDVAKEPGVRRCDLSWDVRVVLHVLPDRTRTKRSLRGSSRSRWRDDHPLPSRWRRFRSWSSTNRRAANVSGPAGWDSAYPWSQTPPVGIATARKCRLRRKRLPRGSTATRVRLQYHNTAAKVLVHVLLRHLAGGEPWVIAPIRPRFMYHDLGLRPRMY